MLSKISAAARHSSFVSAAFSFQLGNNFEIEARITHGRVSNYIIRNDYGETVDDKVIASFKVSVEGVTDGEPARPSGYRDHPAFAADGLFEFATQVKWDWLSIKEFKEEE